MSVIAATLAAATLSACSHMATPKVAAGNDFYSTNEDRVPGRFVYAIDDTSLSKMNVADALHGMQCGAHKVPIDGSSPLRTSIQQTLPLVFQDIEAVHTAPSVESMRRDGIAGFVLITVDDFEPTVRFAPKFFGADADASADLSLGLVVTGQQGRLLATSVNASRNKTTDGGMFCDGGADAMGEATSLAMREALQRIAERLSNSDKIREAARAAVASAPTPIPAAYSPDPGPTLPALDPSKIAGKPEPADLAIVIGVDHYARLPRAEYAASDAVDFSRYATGEMGIAADKVRLLTDGAATRTEIIKAVTDWAKAEMNPGQSTVTVFFSGHGLASPDGKDAYLMPADGDAAVLKDSGIRREEIVERLKQAGAKNVVLVLDTCYAGTSRSGQALMADARPVVLASAEGSFGPGVTVLAAAGNDQISSALPSAGHGAFSYYLMRGLEGGADANGDHRITAAELEAYVKGRVAKAAARLGRDQTPQLAGNGGQVLAQW